ncbi:hypothetical protein BFAG_04658 [Bacteroides fragilis 3_1_12]|jgi:hypothetical protein|uniref:Uncharacterized protein n=1 Tax=Bacteroides fragilis 3_1_12 TaxID=457424 RepID=A0ABN0BSV5_BACFG|nr:hypothetical protein BFAG_04658 [Bacteroides fragilis 3_1_12]
MKIGFIVEMLNDEAAMSRVDKRVRMYMVKRRTVAFTLHQRIARHLGYIVGMDFIY